jgi:hypothetical protein
MRTRHIVVIGVALAALAGCGTGTAKPVANPSEPAPAPSESIDDGTLDATAAYLTALGQLDRKLVGNTRTALDNGMAACVDIEERRSDAVQQNNVATRFRVDAAQAKQILAVTKENLCLE